MRLADEIREQIQAFVDGSMEPHELAGWMDSVADEIGAEDAEARRLSGRTYSLLAEFGYGDRTIKEVRVALADLIAPIASYTLHATTLTFETRGSVQVKPVRMALDIPFVLSSEWSAELVPTSGAMG